MSKKRGRPPRLKAADLKQYGYTYKLEHLTEKEADEREHGIEIIVDGKKRKKESEDYDYFHKQIGESDNPIEVRIYHVNGDYFYKNVRLKSKDQLPDVEKDALSNAKYAELQKQVKDTAPFHFKDHDPAQPVDKVIECSTNTDGSISVVTQSVELTEITLEGGPLDGKKRKWPHSLPFYMEQYEAQVLSNEHGGTNPPAKIVLAARYKRSKEDKTKYIYDPSIG
jgi:hypothetical protein